MISPQNIGNSKPSVAFIAKLWIPKRQARVTISLKNVLTWEPIYERTLVNNFCWPKPHFSWSGMKNEVFGGYCEDEDPKSDLNGQPRLFPRIHLGPWGQALAM